MIRTFVDAGVLIAAARGQGAIAAQAMQVLDDPDREFASSAFIRLEVLPKAIYHKNADEAEFYETFFDSVTIWADDLEPIVSDAYLEACVAGLAAVDALHAAAAAAVEADELVTTEQPQKPIHRARGVKVVSIR